MGTLNVCAISRYHPPLATMNEMKTYEQHIDEIFESFSAKQSKFIEKFDLESYSKWFYDQESELLDWVLNRQKGLHKLYSKYLKFV